jgi:molybdenum cofactor cytidylyltransferase
MGFPKALLRYREETFLDWLAGLFAARCAPVIVVLGAEAERIRAGGHPAATYVVNPDWARGQTTSMQCGLRAVPPEADGVLFTLVDHPAVAPATIDALLAEPCAALVRVPRYHGRRGHPIWLSRAIIHEFLALPETGAARDVVRGHVAETEFVDVDDPGILADIDDPEAYRDLTGGGA